MIEKINKTIKDIYENYDKIKNLSDNIESLSNDVKKLIDETNKQQLVLINAKKRKIEQLNIKLNKTDDNLFSDTFQADKNNIVFNNGFDIDGFLKLKPYNTINVFPSNISGNNNSYNNAELIYHFKDDTFINKLDFYIENKNGINIFPLDIIYGFEQNGETIEDSIFEIFERFFNRFASDVVRKYFFYTKKVSYIKFVFNTSFENININSNIINFYLEEYNKESNLILKYNTNNKSIINFSSNFFDKVDTIKFYYSFDGANYNELLLDKNNSSIIKNEKMNNDLFIKLVYLFSSSAIKNNDILKTNKIILKYNQELEDIIKLCDTNVNNIKLFFTFLSNKKISNVNENIIKSVDGTFILNENFFKTVEGVNQDDINFLSDLDSIESLSSINKPIFILDKKTNTLYIPSCFKYDEINFRIEFEEFLFNELSSNNNNYSPFVFDILLEV